MKIAQKAKNHATKKANRAKKKNRAIRNAYDAYWFLHDHPKLNCQKRSPVSPEDADRFEAEGYLITRDTGGKCYRVWRHLFVHAMDSLEIYYTKTDKPGGHGRVDDDMSKNLYVECWLEMGASYYGYAYSGTMTPMAEWDTETMLHNSHDPDLDTGGSTFDEGLINLAKNVLKRYGDYSDKLADHYSKRWCGKPVCADCRERGVGMWWSDIPINPN